MKWLRLIMLLCPVLAVAQTINPNTPAPVNCGATQTFTFNGFTGAVTGSISPSSGFGTFNCTGTGSGTCTYSPPSPCVTAVNIDRGLQLVPLNSLLNAPVDGLSVDSHSSRWLTRALTDYQCQYPAHPECHHLHTPVFTAVFFSNLVNNSTPTEIRHFYYLDGNNDWQDAPFPLPLLRNLTMENSFFGFSFDSGDRHLITVNKDCAPTDGNCITEIYNNYVDYRTWSFTAGSPTTVSWTTNTIWPLPPNIQITVSGGTGCWAAANGNWPLTPTTQGAGMGTGTFPVNTSTCGPPNAGMIVASIPLNVEAPCQNCNSGGGQKYSSGSYAQLGRVDAASMPIDALSAHNEEWYAATQAGRSDLGHAIRTTMSNNYLSARYQPPAAGFASGNAGFPNGLVTCTAANPTVCTSASDISQSLPCANYTYTVGCTFYINVGPPGAVQLVSPWSGFNGDQTATAIDNTHFSVAFDATGLGACITTNGGCNRFNVYFVQDFFPYGATLRCMALVNPQSVCGPGNSLTTGAPYCKVWINTCKKYGLVIADGTTPADNWDSGTASNEFHPGVLIDAAILIGAATAIQPIENFLEVVNRSSQVGPSGGNVANLNYFQQSTYNRVVVTATDGTHSQSDDILLQGTTLDCDRDFLTMGATATRQLTCWVHGNVNTSLTYAIDSGITGATISGSGLVTMPNCATEQQGMITVSHATDTNALKVYIPVSCIPVSSDGGFRLALGNFTGPFTDASGFIWYSGQTGQAFNNSYPQAGLFSYKQMNGSWQGVSGNCMNDTWSNSGTGTQIYSRSTTNSNDTITEFTPPSSSGGITYNVTFYGEPGFGGFNAGSTCGNSAGVNVFDFWVKNTALRYSLDAFALAGNQPFNGYTLSGGTVVATNADPDVEVTARLRVKSSGTSVSSLLFTPSNIPVITTTSLPSGTVGVFYSDTLTEAGGTAPFNWTFTGTMAPGLTLNASTGVLSGIPLTAGSYTPVFTVTDSLGHVSPSVPLTITIAGPVITISGSLPPTGTVGTPYSGTLTASGGTAPYTFTVVLCTGSFCTGSGPTRNIAGLTLTTASPNATEAGTPTIAGIGSISIQACDVHTNCGARAFPVNISSGGGTLVITTASPLPTATIGIPYMTLINATGGTGAYTWCIVEIGGACDNGTTGALPSGLSLTQSGSVAQISGTVLSSVTPATYGFTVRVTDLLSDQFAKFFQMGVISVSGNAFTGTGNFSMSGSVSQTAH